MSTPEASPEDAEVRGYDPASGTFELAWPPPNAIPVKVPSGTDADLLKAEWFKGSCSPPKGAPWAG